MVSWFANVTVVVALATAVLCLWFFFRKQGPNDYTLGGTLLATLLLIVHAVLAIVGPLVGNAPTGDLLEFWLYLIVAIALPIGGGVWALLDRTRWSTLVLAVLNAAIAVMVLRMLEIWFVQGT
ncbi:hypothetical protein [Leucobacter sp. M11]|uniref:hypothetical protein n=1 Tax=Leucobacter sp. M11 TaxID=2993565 RepID=UPI002D80C3E6|nr:hypothetical protein [Leucobacter sp. M11]MEB4615682.1 hypothetical protein [Leucobacter sp. M11]